MFQLFRPRDDKGRSVDQRIADLEGTTFGLQAIIGAMFEGMDASERKATTDCLKQLLGEGFTVEPTWLKDKNREIFKNSMSHIIFTMLQIHDRPPPQSN
jgi:hypothetical protein